MADKSYGFINIKNMPKEHYVSGDVSREGIRWVSTSDVSDLAANHCGAVAVTNLALYFAGKGCTDLTRKGGGNNQREMFMAVHKIVGNGPKIMIAKDAEKYFASCGYKLNHRKVKNFAGLQKAVGQGHLCGVLLMAGIIEWHWVLAVGWREYASGSRYIRLVDGWNRHGDSFYMPNRGARWMAATEYWIG